MQSLHSLRGPVVRSVSDVLDILIVENYKYFVSEAGEVLSLNDLQKLMEPLENVTLVSQINFANEIDLCVEFSETGQKFFTFREHKDASNFAEWKKERVR